MNREQVKAPEALCIYSNDARGPFLRFLDELQKRTVFFGEKVTVDLSRVTFASAAASLLMFAVINRAQLLMGDANTIKFVFPKKKDNAQGHRWIVGTGLSKALLAGSLDRISSLTANGQYFQSSCEPSAHLISTVEYLDKEAKLNIEQFFLLSTAIGEAMLNVFHHAYEHSKFTVQLEKLGGSRWWQCSWFDPSKDRVVFIICDLGVGIGESYRSGNFKNIDVLSVEQNWVEAALSYGGTRFSTSSERGNGSEDIKRPIGSGCAEHESLRIYTGRTKYSYTSSSGVPECEGIAEHLPGTVVEWTLVPKRSEV